MAIPTISTLLQDEDCHSVAPGVTTWPFCKVPSLQCHKSLLKAAQGLPQALGVKGGWVHPPSPLLMKHLELHWNIPCCRTFNECGLWAPACEVSHPFQRSGLWRAEGLLSSLPGRHHHQQMLPMRSWVSQSSEGAQGVLITFGDTRLLRAPMPWWRLEDSKHLPGVMRWAVPLLPTQGTEHEGLSPKALFSKGLQGEQLTYGRREIWGQSREHSSQTVHTAWLGKHCWMNLTITENWFLSTCSQVHSMILQAQRKNTHSILKCYCMKASPLCAARAEYRPLPKLKSAGAQVNSGCKLLVN